MSLTVAGRERDLRLAITDGRLLVRLRNAIDVGAERDHRFAGAPLCDPCGGNTRDATFNFEAVLLQDSGEVFRGLEFLEAEFAEGEQHVDDLLDHLCLSFDRGEGLGFQTFEAWILRLGAQGQWPDHYRGKKSR